MSPLHLIYIIPVSLFVGSFITMCMIAITSAGKSCDEYMENITKQKESIVKEPTVKKWYKSEMDNNFSLLYDRVGGVVFGVDPNEQMYMIPLESEQDLTEYYDWKVQTFVDIGTYTRPIIGEVL